MMEDLKQGYARKAYPFPTKRYCQFLRLKTAENTIEEYKYWHQSENIWKEIPEGIRKAGILDMEIYLINDLEFMIVETPVDFEWDSAFGKLATFDRQAEWESFMSRFQETSDGLKADQKWQLIERIFSLEGSLKYNNIES